MSRLPQWLHRPLPKGDGLWTTKSALGRLPTVCEEAKCPNLTECWSEKTATFLAMGKACTRACSFCDIDFAAKPAPLEADEPERVAEAVFQLGLKHVVITQVARDDLSDGGAAHMRAIMRAVRARNAATIELLISDLQGNEEALDAILDEQPEILNHNIETIRRLTPKVRHKATYDRTLSVLRTSKRDGILVKSGLMVGFGESEEEVTETLRDLAQAGCDIVTIGQYLRPGKNQRTVEEYVPPEQFQRYTEIGKSLGIPFVYAGPFVRSSYNARAVFDALSHR